MRIRLTHLDGKLPNLALMKLAHYHAQRGDEVWFSKRIEPSLFEPQRYDRVYGSAIFSKSADRVTEFKTRFPQAIVGGTYDTTSNHTIEDVLGIEATESVDYSIYPSFEASIGFTQRGCRLKCGFLRGAQKGRQGALGQHHRFHLAWQPLSQESAFARQ
jgi:hypothetical protein